MLPFSLFAFYQKNLSRFHLLPIDKPSPYEHAE